MGHFPDEMDPGRLAWGAQSLSHWVSRGDPEMHQVERRRWAHGRMLGGPASEQGVHSGEKAQGCAVGVSDLLLQRPEEHQSVCSWGFLHLNMYTGT